MMGTDYFTLACVYMCVTAACKYRLVCLLLWGGSEVCVPKQPEADLKM